MRRLLALLALISSVAFAAEPSPRLAEIAKERQALQMQIQNAQLLFENASLKLEKLDAEEQKIKADAEKGCEEMKKICLAGFLVLLSASVAWAQKTCTRVNATSQTCTVTLTWTASPVDPTHDAPTSYAARRSDAGGAKTQIGTVAASVLTMQNVFTDAGNVIHCYDVLALNTGGSSPPSTPEQCWTTPAIPTLAPNPPTGFQLSALSNTEILLTWKDNSTNETGFQAERNNKVLAAYAMNTTAAIDSGLQPRTWYSYRLRALGDQVNSPWTSMVKTKTPR